MPRKPEPILRSAEFDRPRPQYAEADLQLPEAFCSLTPGTSGGWASNGGAIRGAAERSYPFTLDLPVEGGLGPLRQIHFLGIFANCADEKSEPPGTLGASIQFIEDRTVVRHLELVNGRHYVDCRATTNRSIEFGDGSSLVTVGRCRGLRVDLLSIRIAPDAIPQMVRFKDLGSPASFVIFDAIFEFDPPTGCPFHSRGGGVTLSELPAIVRLGDRVRLQSALDQLTNALERADDLDEARGVSLTFLAMVTAATLELGGSRSMHRVQLDAARELDRCTTIDDILQFTRQKVHDVAEFLQNAPETATERLMNRALAIVDRNYATDLTDSAISEQLGLSTSHFRFLFRQTTGQPFHKYLIAVRLEKARQMLSARDLPVSHVAKAVGFSGLSHFSRAFTQRFDVTPSDLRRGSDAE